MFRLQRSAVVVTTVGLVVTLLAGTSAQADVNSDEIVADVSILEQTERQMAVSATERWANNHGIYRTVQSTDSYSYDSPAGPIVVTTSGDVEVLSDIAEVTADGQTHIAGSYLTELDIDVAAFADNGSAWSQVGNLCSAREQNATGYIDGCYRAYKETNDGSSTKDYYLWRQWGTAKSTGIFTLTQAYGTASRPSGSATWSWVDWSPREDVSRGNCSSITLGVSHIAEMNATYTICDRWDMQKGAAAGTFQNYWRGDAYRTERSYAFMYIISVPQASGTPRWTYNHGFFAW